MERLCNRIEWVHSNITGNSFFYCTNTKLEDLFDVKYVAHIFIHNLFTIINITVYIRSAINVHRVVANINVTVDIKSAFTVYSCSFKVTSSKDIYIQFNVYSGSK